LFVLVNIINTLERLFATSGNLYKLLLIPGFENFRWGLGTWRAWRNYYRAYRRVPAYRSFIDTQGGRPQIHLLSNALPDLSVIPETDKESYVKKYPLVSRVLDGELPLRGVMVDESSGSSGRPTSWVRGPLERSIIKQMLQLSYHQILANEKVFVLNAFALGAWATGLNVSLSLTDITIIKSTGPNTDKIINTMLEFGPGYRYLITGYPPFLKSLIDDKRIDWTQYRVDAVYGGEGISEGLRDHLLGSFDRVLGSYGASDLEINMAGENDFTIALRKAIIEDAELREKLINTEYGVTPMIFQYNPLAYYLETNKQGELVVTLCRPCNISPKIRYNIHDRGHVLKYGVLKQILEQHKRNDILALNSPRLDLPVLFLYGRSDASIEYYGAKVTPDSVREVLYATPELTPHLNTFKLLSYEDDSFNKRMEVVVELIPGARIPDNASQIADDVFQRLGALNGDFYNAMYRTATPDNLALLRIYEYGTGPFAGGQHKLKNEYVASEVSYDKL
jgi:phenylacetate-CoA ligase